MRRASIAAALLCACSAGSPPPPVPPPARAAAPPSTTAATAAAPPGDVAAKWWQSQVSTWRAAAKGERGDAARIDALKQLAWARDPAGVDLAKLSLSVPAAQKTAALALAEYGHDAATAREPLLAALPSAAPDAKPALTWALVVAGEPRAFDSVVALTRTSELGKLERLDGGAAFDARRVGALAPLEKFIALASDPSADVRALAAAVLSYRADAKSTEALARLAADADVRVAREALPGLAKLGDARALEALTKALRTIDAKRQGELLAGLAEQAGTSGLVLALAAAPKDEKGAFWYRKRIFDLISAQQAARGDDPSGADALVRFIESKPHVHFETRAALALAAVGDLRAVPTLARRLRMDPLAIYGDKKEWEQMLRRDDNERVVAARMLADLALLHPDAHAALERDAADALIFWAHERPSPHANALRALAAMGSKKDLQALRDWAAPQVPLPKEGDQPPMPEEWIITQVALRYLGKLRDEPSWPLFPKALAARPRDVDVTMEGIMQGGMAILGMSLRALGVGAADGMSEWRDHRGFEPLLDYIEDAKNNEQSRQSACTALAWVAQDSEFGAIVDRVARFPGSTDALRFTRACFIETLLQRSVPGLAPRLLQVLDHEATPEARQQLARAIAKSGIDDASREKLAAMLASDTLMTDAALALLLGGTPEVATYAVARVTERKPAALAELAESWFNSLGYWSDEDVERGALFRYVENALAVSRLDDRFRVLLAKQLENLEYDNGPHSVTRVVLRYRLWQLAKAGDERKRAQAVRTLELMNERGVLYALAHGGGPAAELAREAHFRVLHPRPASAVLPDAAN